MALTLFARRPDPAEPPAPEPAPWPEIGETWKPEGVTIVQRYYNQAHAVVLVYTSSRGYRHNVDCLGCHFVKASNQHTNHGWLELKDAAEAANDHATTCRALPRDITARPDDDTARERLLKWVSGCRSRVADEQIWIESLDLLRLSLQRTDDWILAALQQLALDHPEMLRAEPSEYSDRTDNRYFAQCYPES
ncbi:hypothetical protein QFZ56_000050 [Streptomyces achromogenes]|uniref:Uncharacterized protein n=1 Tax=Streptomyces achromogenes TaxID=67255 RepID=A0ABU0PRU1_STRAH|nr:hypothetical protein [Streptomyces achromogenes]MDQ0681087.1 hypothetical protein [Streptomyces achromogenes]